MRMDYYDEPYAVPDRFFEAETARRYLEHIQYRSRPDVENVDGVEILSMASSEEVTLFKKETRRMVTVEEMEALRKQLVQWMKAFQPLYDRIVGNREEKSYIAAKTLKSQGLQTYLLLHGPLRPNLPTSTLLTSDEELNFVCKEII
jgi:hypothetical protein